MLSHLSSLSLLTFKYLLGDMTEVAMCKFLPTQPKLGEKFFFYIHFVVEELVFGSFSQSDPTLNVVSDSLPNLVYLSLTYGR